MSNPEYIVFTDSELEHVRRSYFEQKRLGTEHSVALSKELLCRLIRNTMTNMISIARATEDSRYPSKHEVNAMAKRLVEYYPMIKDRSSSSNTEWVLDELRRIIQPTNSQYISEMKDRWEIFYSKVQFYGIMKKAMKPPKTLNGVEHAAAVFRALPLLFPSSTMPPRKLGANSEALFHVLTTSEDPDGFLHQRPLSCPVVVVSEDNCMIAIGSTPVATSTGLQVDLTDNAWNIPVDLLSKNPSSGFEKDNHSQMADTISNLTPGDPIIIDIDTVVRCLKRTQAKKAPGSDEIGCHTLKHCAEQIGGVFQQLFLNSLANGTVPQAWKHSTIIPIPKKSCPKFLKDLTPIALTSLLMKA
ncbi:hypothetical protein AAFF_G00247540 [Aldrovandia affinis]|uniref:Uncharacterized protein n=1 Tax=Aldrovandia affinis TaxID=143900 RepID=A0AAD7SW73_9TELE|nr:hypothetical protein AAFF_G00247540 [Aldrovandia affinis]